jgi:hypothetical protein
VCSSFGGHHHPSSGHRKIIWWRSLLCTLIHHPSSTLHIRLCGLFPFRINSEIMNLLDSWYDSFDGGATQRKVATYTRQHKHRIKAHRHPCLEWDSNPRSQCLSEKDRAANVIGYSSFLLWRIFHDEELQNLYSSHSFIRTSKSWGIKWFVTCKTYGKDEKSIQTSDWKIWCKDTLGWPKGRSEDNIKNYVNELGVKMTDSM